MPEEDTARLRTPRRNIAWMPDPFDLGPEFLRRVPLFAELQRLLQWQGGPVNWDLASQLAVASAGPLEGAGARAVAEDAANEAARHAGLLIESVAELPSVSVQLVGPVAFAEAIATDARDLFEAVALRANAGFGDLGALPDGMPEGIGDALKSVGPFLQGAQAGSVIGTAAADVIGWCDLGLPIERETALLVPVVVGRITREENLDERGALLASMLLSLIHI